MITEKKIFNHLKQYETKIKGISMGFDILRQLSIKNIKEGHEIVFYDFLEDKEKNYFQDNFNYEVEILYNRLLIKYPDHNKLYWVMLESLSRHYEKSKYNFVNTTIDLQRVLRKFIQGLRLSRIPTRELQRDPSTLLVFDLNKAILNYDFSFSKESECEDFFMFIFKYVIMELWGAVLHYDKQTNTIMFYEKFQSELEELMTFSFDLMKFGDYSNFGYHLIDLEGYKFDRDLETQYQQYQKNSNFYKMWYDSDILSMILCYSVKKISVFHNMNNMFINPN